MCEASEQLADRPGRVQDWIRENTARGTQLVFANPSRQVTRMLENAGIPDKLGRNFICVRMHDAVDMCSVRPGTVWHPQRD